MKKKKEKKKLRIILAHFAGPYQILRSPIYLRGHAMSKLYVPKNILIELTTLSYTTNGNKREMYLTWLGIWDSAYSLPDILLFSIG